MAIIGIVFFGVVFSVIGDICLAKFLNRYTVLGALFALFVSMSLAVNFVIICKENTFAFELALGFGSAIAGLSAFVLFPTALLINFESLLYISSTGIIILAISCYFLPNASRFTSAVNFSILMLLKTVLDPLWVQLGVGETPGPFGFIGGAFVVVALFYFYVGQKAAPLHSSSKSSPPAN